MSPRAHAHAQGISWRFIGPGVALWLMAVIALSALTSPATASQAPAERSVVTAARTLTTDRPTPDEAPVVTLLLAGIGVIALAVRPARRAVARRRVR